MTKINSNMTPTRRAHLEQVAARGVRNRSPGNRQYSQACRILGWTELVWDDGKIVGELITDAGRDALAGQ